MKEYHVDYNIWKTKYLVSFHDWISKHKDGSLFFDVRLFTNKKDLNTFTKELHEQQYTETCF